MSSNTASDAYLKMVTDIEELIDDEKLIELLDSRKRPKDENEAEKLGKVAMLKVVAYLLQHRRENVWNIIAALNETTPEEIAEESVITLAKQLLGVLQDRDLFDFFISLGKWGTQQL